jgi:flagellar basal-body rod protein FlgF
MNRGIYTGAKGMMTTTQWMDVVTNNLANASTDAYKADKLAFADILVRKVNSDGGRGNELGTLGGGPSSIIENTDFSVGALRTTGNPLDLALKDARQFFAVNANGITQFTRDGSFSLNADRVLVNDDGHPVLDYRGFPIKFKEKGEILIEADGGVKQGGEELTRLAVYEGDFRKAGRNLWTATQTVLNDKPEIAVGSLEGSNVEAVTAMVDLIKINRFFEMSQRSIQTQDEMTTKLVDVINRR